MISSSLLSKMMVSLPCVALLITISMYLQHNIAKKCRNQQFPCSHIKKTQAVGNQLLFPLLQGLQKYNFMYYLVLEEYRDANVKINLISIEEFIPNFLEIFKKGGSIIGKVVIDPHK